MLAWCWECVAGNGCRDLTRHRLLATTAIGDGHNGNNEPPTGPRFSKTCSIDEGLSLFILRMGKEQKGPNLVYDTTYHDRYDDDFHCPHDGQSYE